MIIKKICVMMCGIFLICALSGCSSVNNRNAIQENHSSKLYLKGTDLVDENDQIVVLKGLSSHGLTWYPEYCNYPAMKSLKELGANTFRIAVYPEQNDGYIENPELMTKLLYAAVENALAADLYVIIDWHVLRDETPLKYKEDAKQFFTEISQRYTEEDRIIYEICNEPNGNTTYEDVYEYANEIIPIIQENVSDAIILVGTPKYCTNLEGPMEHPLPYDNVMYTYHFYSDLSDGKNAVKKIEEAREKSVPVFVSEWGYSNKEDNEGEKQNADVFMEYLTEKKISWISWALSNKDEGHALLLPEVEKVSGWNQDDFTVAGKYVVGWLSNFNIE